MRDDYDLLLMWVLGLIAVTLYLTVRYVMVLESRLDALAFEFYRGPRIIEDEAGAG